MLKFIIVFGTALLLNTTTTAQLSLIGKWKVVAMEREGEKMPLQEDSLRNYMYTQTFKEKPADYVLTKEDSLGVEMAINIISKSIGNMELQFGKDKKLTITTRKKTEIETYIYNTTTKILTTTNNKKKTKKMVVTLLDYNLKLESKEGDKIALYLERL